LKIRDTKLEEFNRKQQPQTVTIEDIQQKIVNRNLKLTIKFKLTPIGYGLCSHLKAILYFDKQHIKTFYTSVPKAMKDMRKELTVEIFTKFGQVAAGPHQMRMEMSGLLPSGQTLGLISSKEFTVQAPKPEELEKALRKQIIIEKIEGASGVEIITSDVQKLYKEMEERQKRELQASRQRW